MKALDLHISFYSKRKSSKALNILSSKALMLLICCFAAQRVTSLK